MLQLRQQQTQVGSNKGSNKKKARYYKDKQKVTKTDNDITIQAGSKKDRQAVTKPCSNIDRQAVVTKTCKQ